MPTYRTLRTIHLLIGVTSVAFLLMYGVSAVQMAHNSWFRIKPGIREQRVALTPHIEGARQLARVLMDRGLVRGNVQQTATTPSGLTLRVVRPGTVSDISYDAATGVGIINTSTAGFIGMLNRLHHTAGLYHEYGLLNAWGWAIALISGLLITLGITGLWMCWLRRQERRLGVILLSANLAFSLTLLALIRSAGP
jgi:hypothetical protein